MNSNKEKGRCGEELAAAFLKRQGYRIIKRNFKSRFAEIDIIAQKGRKLCFIEVKSRASTNFGLPCEAVQFPKQERIRKLAECFIRDFEGDYEEISFDIIEIYLKEGQLNHMQDVF